MKLYLILILVGVVQSGEWGYEGEHGPNLWEENAPSCGKNSQSPINIDSDEILPDSKLGVLSLNGYEQVLSGGGFVNNGHTVQLNFPKDKQYNITAVGLDGVYTALQLHFHWAASDTENGKGGSEHTVNGKHSVAEMHIVHMKQPYTSLEDVKNVKDGLAVIGVFLQLDPANTANPDYQLLFDAIKNCQYKGDESELVTGPTPLSLLPDSGSYYRYDGSLTTPPCYQSVQWLIYQHPVLISQTQLEVFQNLISTSEPDTAGHTHSDGTTHSHSDEANELGDNYRPVQPLNGRIVTEFLDIKVNNDQDSSNWHYSGSHGPDQWWHDYAGCSGSKQSPINIAPSSVEQDEEEASVITFSAEYLLATKGGLVNNGHTAKFTIADSKLEFKEGTREYRALQAHFHWGAGEDHGNNLTVVGGSEHTVNGDHYPMELHIVHEKIEPGSNNEVSDDSYGVLGVFLRVVPDKELVNREADDAMKKMTDHFLKVSYEGATINIEDGPVLFDILPSNKSYYRYMGSLTTPPCTEAVLWTIFAEPVAISEETFMNFQTLYKVSSEDLVGLDGNMNSDTASDMDEAFISGNYRPTQPLEGRTVYYYEDMHESATEITAADDDVLQIVLWTVGGLVLFVGILTLLICCNKKKTHKYKKGKQEEDI